MVHSAQPKINRNGKLYNKWNKKLRIIRAYYSYPIPISLYNCYRTVRHEKRGISTPDSVSHASLSCKRYRDGVALYAASCSTSFS